MSGYKEESVERSGTTVKLFDEVAGHFYPTRRAAVIGMPALSNPLPVVPATACGLFLAESEHANSPLQNMDTRS